MIIKVQRELVLLWKFSRFPHESGQEKDKRTWGGENFICFTLICLSQANLQPK